MSKTHRSLFRMLALILALAMLLSCAGCKWNPGKKNETGQPEDPGAVDPVDPVEEGPVGYTSADILGDGFIACGTGGRVDRISLDGEVTTLDSGTTEKLNCVYTEGSNVLISGNNGTLLMSTDAGESFRSVKTGASGALNACTAYQDVLYAAGEDGVIYRQGSAGWKKVPMETDHEIVGLVSTNYCTSKDTTKSYGPYKMTSFQDEKQCVYVQNENWYGYEKVHDADGNEYLVSFTDYLVDGESVQRYMATSIVIDVMTDDAAKEAFLKGDLDDWAPPADQVVDYATSEQLYKVDETYMMSFFFNTNLDNLKEMDASKGNTNSVVLSNETFRRAFSLAIDRAEWVTATAGYKPYYSLLNELYYYDVYNDPESIYRHSDQAMQAICNLYDVKYGEGTPYKDLKEAYDSITGYNLTEAKELMKKAYTELTEAGVYNGGDIHIRVGYKKGALDSTDNTQVELIQKYLNAALEGSGFGKAELEAVGNIENRYKAVPDGEFAIGYGAWGGAAFYPFRNMQVYCDTEQYAGQINEAADWDPATETLTLKLNGEDVTMTWQEWSRSCVGTGRFSTADFETKLNILSAMEELFLKKYYRIPLAGSTSCSMLSYKLNYFTENYNIMYGFGGLELMRFNYTDEEWAAAVKEAGGVLEY